PINERSFNKLPIVLIVTPIELGIRCSLFNVSCNFQAIIAKIINPIKLKKIKILFQLVPLKDKIAQPAIGATIGATALITINKAKNLVNNLPLKTSRTTAREITTPAEAVNHCKKRTPITTVRIGE